MARARRRWMREQDMFDPARLVFIDETSANTKMVRLYGRALAASELKADLRKAAERTIPRLRRRIGRFARTLTARETSNYFRHAGYA